MYLPRVSSVISCAEKIKRKMRPKRYDKEGTEGRFVSERAHWCLLGGRCYPGCWLVTTRMSGKPKDGRNRGLPTWLLATGKRDFKPLFGSRQVKKEGIDPFLGADGMRLVQNQQKTTTDCNFVFLFSVKERALQTREDKTNFANKK